MSQLTFSLIALAPFVLLFILIVLLRWPVLKTMPLVWFLTALSAFFLWGMDIQWISASLIKGMFIAIEIMLIIFSAVLVLALLQEKKQIYYLHSLLGAISPDVRIQALIVAWLFGSLIEGVAGFGTPAALAAPLLVSLGFTPFLAVVVSLIANSTATSFGAAGTPVLLGLGGLGFDISLLKEVTRTTALFHSIASFIVPLAIVYFIVCHFKHNKKDSKKAFLSTIPFAIFSWLSFVIPYFLVAWFIGPELPSIIGGFVGLFIVCTAAHFRFLTPKRVMTFKKEKHKEIRHKLNLKKSIFSIAPYAIIILLLTLSRTIPFLKTTLSNISIGIKNILGIALNYKFLPFYTPSFYFFLSAIICIFLYRANKKEVGSAFRKTFNKIKFPTISLIFAIALAQLFLVSGNNTAGLESMPLVLAQFVASTLKSLFAFASPLIGAFGAFMAGSNTVSNLLFASFQAETAKTLGLSLVAVLALQVVGGAIGNMIAVHNVLAANAAVGLKGQVGNVIRKTIIISLIYALLVGALAFAMFYFL